MSTSKWAVPVAIAAMASAADAADLRDVTLTHYEPLARLELHTLATGAANASLKSGGTGPLVMSFDAMGRRFDLQLEPNSRLVAAARGNPALDGVDIYRGEIAGDSESWVRIVVADGMPRGMIFDGQDLYAIEAPGDSIVESAVPVIYRLADARVVPGSMSCGSSELVTSGAVAADSLLGELGAISQAPGAISEINLGAVGDFEFTSSKGGDAAAAAAISTRLNNVDGIFSEQVGVQITVQVIETFSTAADPFTDVTEASTLLDELSDYRSTTPAQNSNGLTHLYTGKNLNGSTVGIAWRGALCSNYFGAGLSEGNGSSTFDSLVAAHEIGHNFGAPHDGESGSACESVTGQWLMSPQLNGSDQFSSCSLDQMAAEIAGASCIAALPAIDVAVALGSSSTVLYGADATLSYDVVNNGTVDATNVNVDVTLPANLGFVVATPSAGTCTSGAGTISCALGDIPGLGSRTIDITVTPGSLGVGTLSAVVSADTDDRPANNQESLQVNVAPAVDLVVGTPMGASIKLEQSTTVTASIENRATLNATGATLTINLGNALQATAASWSVGSCTVLSQLVTCQAPTLAAGASSSLSVTATGILAGNPNVTVTASSVEADLVPGDNSASGRLQVRDPKDNSGGGATGAMFLLMLLGAALLRRRP